MRLRLIAILLALAALMRPAFAADSYWPTPGGAQMTGEVTACLNTSGQSVPWWASSGAWQCAGSAVPISGTITASLGSFTPSASGARGTPFTVNLTDSSGTLPTGAVVVVSNPGANPMYCNVNGVAATVSDQPVPASDGWFAFTIPTGVTTLHCIATGGTTTANMLGGSGLPTGTGGGGSGSGTVYVATPTFSNSTITTTNTWQSLLTADALRRSCNMQNQGTHTMFFQVTAANTAPTGTAAAVQIAAGQTVVCNDYIGDVMQGYVWITGTAADPYQVTSFH
jgi:hypothetical protein